MADNFPISASYTPTVPKWDRLITTNDAETTFNILIQIILNNDAYMKQKLDGVEGGTLNIAGLQTVDKSIGGAINEVNTKTTELYSTALNKGASKIGLHDANGNFVATEVEGAMAELFQNVSNGKTAVGTAITGVDPTVVIPTNPTFAQLATGIGQISTGKKFAKGETVAPSNGIPFENYNNTSISVSPFVKVSGLDFVPRIVIVTNKATPIGTPTFCSDIIIYMGYSMFKKNKQSATFSYGTFTMPVIQGNLYYKWEAYE